jgi:hypothetical protein
LVKLGWFTLVYHLTEKAGALFKFRTQCNYVRRQPQNLATPQKFQRSVCIFITLQRWSLGVGSPKINLKAKLHDYTRHRHGTLNVAGPYPKKKGTKTPGTQLVRFHRRFFTSANCLECHSSHPHKDQATSSRSTQHVDTTEPQARSVEIVRHSTFPTSLPEER